jgi:NAD(P)-dependent dehydrogenase (short-subunit alcohol dehydrogenase family)
MKIEGAVALVSGANRGLGRALVSALLGAGAAKVYATARNAAKLPQADARVVPLELDTTRPEQIAAAVRKASDVTLLVNNAGALTSYSVLAMRPEDFDADLRTNVVGTLAMIKGFLPTLERAPNGAAVVNILSLTSLGSFPALGGYSASKAAAYSVTQALRPELKAKGVEILAVLPGPIDTDMVRALPMPKTSAEETAKGVVEGIAHGEEEIFPDPMARQMAQVWRTSAKEFERAFASF